MDALEQFARSTLEPMVREQLPIGDPDQDPDPAVSLRDALRVYRDGREIVIEINTPYAAVQHYALYEHPRGGRGRFLEDTIQQASRLVEDVVADRVRARLARET